MVYNYVAVEFQKRIISIILQFFKIGYPKEILEKYFLRIGGALIPSIIPVADGVFTEEEREIRELKSA